MPLQGLALAAADEKDDVAQDIGAANTMVWRPQGGYKALNTDWVGVKIAIEKSLGSGEGGLANLCAQPCGSPALHGSTCNGCQGRHQSDAGRSAALRSHALGNGVCLSVMAAPVQQMARPCRLLGRRRWWWVPEGLARPLPTTQPRLVLRWGGVGTSCLLPRLPSISTPWVSLWFASKHTAVLMLWTIHAPGAGLGYAGRQGSAGGRQPGQGHSGRVYGRCQRRHAKTAIAAEDTHCNVINCSICFCCYTVLVLGTLLP